VTSEQEELNAHAIVIGYGRVGQRVTRGLRQAGIPVVVIEQDLHIVRELVSAGLPAVFGDASYANVLAAAHPERARLVVVALPDFGATRAAIHRVNVANPNVPIVARAQRAENDVTLRDAGATAVVVPEIAGALMLLEETLILLGLPHDHILTHLSALSAARVEAVKNEMIDGQAASEAEANTQIEIAAADGKTSQPQSELPQRESTGQTSTMRSIEVEKKI
jgi:CPA2 family monovalent cation:H+ antiporter-2